ncbi:MAG: lamin tail domain-containing protein [Anaerolineae bacterium]|nr:lamin tail domain-containing protein [Anaerolineae bacterium]
MTLKRRLMAVALSFWLVSLACSGVETSPPADTATPLPLSSTAPPISLPPTVTVVNPPPATPGSSSPTQPEGLETVTVAQVVDGDTVELTNGRRVRYIGINTPERDQPYYNEATALNRQLVEGKQVQLEFDLETFDQYGRSLAYVWADGRMVNLEIVQQGFANSFTVQPNIRYEAEFRQAEREAREAGRGLWAGSEVALKIIQIQADAPGSDNENPNGEWVEIANQGHTPVQMQGFTLKDEANHIYTFGDFTVAPGAAFRLYSGQGETSANALYWGLSGESIWNNNGDAAYLRDTTGALVDTFAY